MRPDESRAGRPLSTARAAGLLSARVRSLQLLACLGPLRTKPARNAILWPMNTTIKQLAGLLQRDGLLASTANLPILPEEHIYVSGCDCDSRVVQPGHLFVCKGQAFKPEFLTSALSAGAVGYLCEESLFAQLATVAPNTPALITTNIRSAMALVSAAAWGYPNKKMQIAGITGTKGKTTVAYFVRAILDGNTPLSRAATLGTLETYDGVERHPSRNTTPEAPDLWRHLAHAASSSLDMVMEVSSQGLKYQRVEGVAYDVAAFLNIGVDHVSPIEHPTFEDYLASKLKIFEDARVAVINACLDSQHAKPIFDAARSCKKVVTFAMDNAQRNGLVPDVWASGVAPEPGGIAFTLHTPQWTAPTRIGLTGLFNVENALAAAAIAQQMGCTQEQILAGLARCRVPGRMDVASSEDGQITAIVDYAHNGMAVQTVLSAVRKSYSERYIVAVFGATGGKGAERRFEMPPAAAPYVDHLIFTEDDAGPEPVERICAQMVEATPAGTSYEIVLDRTDAVRRAFDLARCAGRPAVVCVLGKGHEARQLRKDGPAPMIPDGELVRTLL